MRWLRGISLVVFICFCTLYPMEELDQFFPHEGLTGQRNSLETLFSHRYSSPMTSQVLGIVSLLVVLNNLTQPTRTDPNGKSLLMRIYEGDMSQVASLVYHMFMLGCVSYALKLSWDMCAYGANHVTHIYNFVRTSASRTVDFYYGRGAPFDVEYLGVLEHLFESIGATLSDQTVSGNLMLRDFRTDDEHEDEAQEINWHYFVAFTTESFEHISAYLNEHIAYYQHKKAGWFGGAAQARGIVFVANTIVKNLRHLAQVCARAHYRDEVDAHHTRQIAQNTLLLFKKLRLLVRGISTSYESRNEQSFSSTVK